MALSVVYLLGRFPVLTEYPVIGEIAAVADLGVEVSVAAIAPTATVAPAGADELARRVRYLDVARGYGRAAAGAAGMLTLAACALTRGDPWRPCVAVPRAFGHPLAMRWRCARLARMLETSRADLVHAQFAHLGFLALPAVRKLRLPLVLSFRGRDLVMVRGVQEEARAALFDAAGAILARSEDMRRDLLRLGAPEAKLRVLPTGVDVRAVPFRERIAPAPEEPVRVLTVARDTAKKGIEDARAAVEACAREWRIEWRWLRDASHEEVLREMQRAHIFLLPSRTAPDGEKEGVPNAIKEAMAAGLPVISTRHAGIPECVTDGVNGLLAAEGDRDGIAERLRWLLGHPEVWAAMGRSGRAAIEERYDVRRIASTLVAHYHGLVRAAAGAVRAG